MKELEQHTEHNPTTQPKITYLDHLLKVNLRKHGIDPSINPRTRRAFRKLEQSVVEFEKYTVVELKMNGKFCHGLSVRNPCDNHSSREGIAIAYSRAFEKLAGFINMKDVADDTLKFVLESKYRGLFRFQLMQAGVQ